VDAKRLLPVLMAALDRWDSDGVPSWHVLNSHWGVPEGARLAISDFPGETAPEADVSCFFARVHSLFARSTLLLCQVAEAALERAIWHGWCQRIAVGDPVRLTFDVSPFL